MNQQIRFVLFAAFSVAVLFGWQVLFPPPEPPPSPPEAPSAQAPDAGAPPAVVAPGEQPSPSPAPAETPEPPARELTVETELWKAVFTTRGAGLRSFELTRRKVATRADRGEEPEPTNLAFADAQQVAPLAAEIVLPGGTIVGPGATWEIEEQEDALLFTRRQGDITLTKRITWQPGTYQLGLELEAKGPGVAGDVAMRVHYSGWESPDRPTGGFFAFGAAQEIHQAVCRADGSLERMGWDDDDKRLTPDGRPSYAGLDLKYFITALSPRGELPASCTIAGPRPGALEATLEQTARAEGQRAAAAFDVYLGPKDTDLLAAAGHELEESVDFGFLAAIARLLLVVLKLFEKLAGNWGVAIILLTVLMKALTFPLTHRQMMSMEEMRRLAPKIEEIKKKFGNDQQRVNVETMKMYKEHNVQPLGGCLPMLIQMPVWFALYTMLSTSFELYNEPFVSGWINDLTSKDPYYVTPVLMTVTMVLSQLLTPQTQQNQQMKFLMYGMPIFFGVIMLSLPAGLVLYIFTNNILSIGQSLWFRRRFGHPEVKA